VQRLKKHYNGPLAGGLDFVIKHKGVVVCRERVKSLLDGRRMFWINYHWMKSCEADYSEALLSPGGRFPTTSRQSEYHFWLTPGDSPANPYWEEVERVKKTRNGRVCRKPAQELPAIEVPEEEMFAPEEGVWDDGWTAEKYQQEGSDDLTALREKMGTS